MYDRFASFFVQQALFIECMKVDTGNNIDFLC